jgi:hypothetical protein
MNRITNITNQMSIGYLALSLRKILAAVIMSCLSLAYIGAQEADTEFWFAVPYLGINTSPNFNNPITLTLVNNTDRDATVSLNFAAQSPINTSYNISAGGVYKLQIASNTTGYMPQIGNPSTQGGVHITSDVPISAFFALEHNNTREIYTFKGHKALGTLFYVPMQNDGYHQATNNNARNNAAIIATEDGTVVQITRYPHSTNSTSTINMARGETYLIREGSANQVPSLAGTKIESNHPIAVTITEDCKNNDIEGDQIIPVSGLGRVYIVPSGYGIGPDTRVYIFATQPGTTTLTIQPGGGSTSPASIRTLNGPGDGTCWEFDYSTGLVYIEASQPVYVYHDEGGYMGASVVAPAYSAKQTRAVVFQMRQNFSFYNRLTFLFRNGDEDSFFVKYGPALASSSGTGSLNATEGPMSLTSIYDVPNVPGWKYGTFDMPTLANTNQYGRFVAIRNSKGPFSMSHHSGYVRTPVTNGLGAGAYGYFSTYGQFEFSDTTYLCGHYVTLTGGFANEYLWTRPDGSTEEDVISIDATEEGYYTLRMIQNSILSVPVISDTIYSTTYVKKVNAGVISPSVILMCAATDNPGTLSVTGVVAPGGTTYQWQRSTDRETWTNIGTGATLNANSYKPTASIRTYYYRRGMTSPECGMAYTDPIMITLDVSGGTTSPASQTVCDGTPATTLTLTGATNPAGTTYQWQSSPDLSNWTPIPSATSATYTPVKPANVLYSQTVYYQCAITTTCGTAYSYPATVNFSPCMIPVNPHLMSKIIVQ